MNNRKPDVDTAVVPQTLDGTAPNAARWALGVLPAVLIACLGLWLSAGLFLKAQPKLPSESAAAEQHQALVAWGQAQAKALGAALDGVIRALQQDSKNPKVAWALGVGTEPALQQAMDSLPRPAGVVSTRIFPKGSYLSDKETSPLGYAVRDLLRRAETGVPTSPEAYYRDGHWQVYLAMAVPAETDASPAGTLLRVLDLSAFVPSSQSLPPEVSQVRLVQHLGNGPTDTLLERSQGDASLSLASNNPNWSLALAGGPSTQVEPVGALPASQAGAWLAALPALLGGLLGGLWLALVLGRPRNSAAPTLVGREVLSGLSITEPAPAAPAPSVAASKAPAERRPLERRPSVAAGGVAREVAPLPQAVAGQQAAPEAKVEPAPGKVEHAPLDFDLSLDVAAREGAPSKPAKPAGSGEGEPAGAAQEQENERPMIDFKLSSSEPVAAGAASKLPADIFRAYDIRGIVDKTLTTDGAYWIGRAVGSQALAVGETVISVGRDGRLSGPQLTDSLIRGITESGCDVTDVGMVPTPVLYYAANVLDGRSGIMVTGSHNPPDYNGFKTLIAGDSLANEQIQWLRQRIDNDNLESGSGQVRSVDITQRYADEIRRTITLKRRLKVVVDCGNGVTGAIAPALIESLGCEVIPLFTEVDGHFPNHHPDPSKPENLEDLIEAVHQNQADLGLAFDGDGDRVGVVSNTGNVIYPDRLLMLLAKDLVQRNPGAEVIYDVKCSRRVGALIEGAGGVPVMYKTGHSLIKKKMRDSGALLAGEMSGHIFFKERWYGFDDGIYTAARLLEILSADARDTETVFADFPSDLATPEINIQVTEETKFPIVQDLVRKGSWGAANLVTLDGLRVEFPQGWGLVRASNTSPVLVLRFEAENAEALAHIQQLVRAQLLAVAPDLEIPF